MCYNKYPTMLKLNELAHDAATAGANPVFKFLMSNGLMPGSERFCKNRECMYQFNRGVHPFHLSKPLLWWLRSLHRCIWSRCVCSDVYTVATLSIACKHGIDILSFLHQCPPPQISAPLGRWGMESKTPIVFLVFMYMSTPAVWTCLHSSSLSCCRAHRRHTTPP